MSWPGAWKRRGNTASSWRVEPHVGSFANSPKRAEKLAKDVPGLTLTLDHGHLYPRGYSEDEVNNLFRYTSHFHARFVSNKGGPATQEGNTLNWKKVLRAMEKAGYKGWIELEYGGNDITPDGHAARLPAKADLVKLKLACADYTFPILPHDQVLQIISILGLQGVNVALFQDRSHLQPSTEFANVRRSARRLKKRLDDNGLVAADVFLQLSLDLSARGDQPSQRTAPQRCAPGLPESPRLRLRVRR